MKNRRTVLIVAATISVVAFVVIFRFLGGAGTEKKTDSTKTGKNESRVLLEADIPPAFRYRLTPGSAYNFSFRRSVLGTMGDDELINIHLTGVFSAHVIAAESDEIQMIIAVEFSSMKGVEIEQRKRGGGGDTHNTALLTIDSSGLLRSLRFPVQQRDPKEQDVLRDLIASWLTTVPNEGTAELARKTILGRLLDGLGVSDERGPYILKSADTQGEYRALLSFGDLEKSKARIAMGKQTYLRSATPVAIQYSQHISVWGREDPLYTMKHGEDRLVIGPEGFMVETRQDYEFNLTAIGQSLFAERDRLQYSKQVSSLYDEKIYRPALASGDDSKLPIRPWSDLTRDLMNLNAQATAEEKHRLFNDLCNHIRKKPERAVDALELAEEFRTNDDRFQMILGALAYGGTSEIQAELVRFYREGAHEKRLDESGRVSVMNAFAMMDGQMSGDAMRFLNDEYSSAESQTVRDSAALALASGHRSNPEWGTIRKVVGLEWRLANTDERKMVVLDVIGNSGEKDFFPIVREAMLSNNPALWGKALSATRFMDTEQVNRFLIDVASGQRDETLKEKAVESLANHAWRDEYETMLESCVRNGVRDSLRIRCAEMGLANNKYRPAMASILKSIRGRASSRFGSYIDRSVD